MKNGNNYIIRKEFEKKVINLTRGDIIQQYKLFDQVNHCLLMKIFFVEINDE